MLHVQGLEKKIGELEILKDISFNAALGDIVCIIGPSGAGKTMLLKCISLLESHGGAITIDGNTYGPIDAHEPVPMPYPKLTVVFQHFFLWPHLTVRENILLPQRGQHDQLHFKTLIQLFDMERFLDKYPNEVSGGERQRGALARALMLKPSYLLLDEVTSALDIEQSYLILRHLKEIAQSGTAIVLVTHALHFAEQVGNKVIFLDKGRIIEQGSPNILKNPQSSRLRSFLNAAAIAR